MNLDDPTPEWSTMSHAAQAEHYGDLVEQIFESVGVDMVGFWGESAWFHDRQDPFRTDTLDARRTRRGAWKPSPSGPIRVSNSGQESIVRTLGSAWL